MNTTITDLNKPLYRRCYINNDNSTLYWFWYFYSKDEELRFIIENIDTGEIEDLRLGTTNLYFKDYPDGTN